MKRKLTFRRKHVRNEENEWEETPPPALFDLSGESPNRFVMPRKIGKRRPEEERGYKPIVI